jgi:hypothetical protein
MEGVAVDSCFSLQSRNLQNIADAAFLGEELIARQGDDLVFQKLKDGLMSASVRILA